MNWYKVAKAQRTFQEIMQNSEHYQITCSGCGDMHQCRCDSPDRVVATVISCPTCEEDLEKEADGATSPSSPYSDNAAIQDHPRKKEIAPSRLRDFRRLRKLRKKKI